jgi:hypothetical protein
MDKQTGSKKSTRRPSRKTVWVKASKLNPAIYNPPSRTQHTDVKSKIPSLMRSIDSTQFYYPILITPGKAIIDGHRRWMSLMVLGHEYVECLVYEGDADRLFAELNGEHKPHTCRENLYKFLQSSDTLKGVVRLRHERMMDLLGRDNLEWMLQNKLSWNTFDIAKKVARYVQLDPKDRGHVMKVLHWFKDHGTYGAALEWVKSGKSPATLSDCLHRNVCLPR